MSKVIKTVPNFDFNPLEFRLIYLIVPQFCRSSLSEEIISFTDEHSFEDSLASTRSHLMYNAMDFIDRAAKVMKDVI